MLRWGWGTERGRQGNGVIRKTWMDIVGGGEKKEENKEGIQHIPSFFLVQYSVLWIKNYKSVSKIFWYKKL